MKTFIVILITLVSANGFSGTAVTDRGPTNTGNNGRNSASDEKNNQQDAGMSGMAMGVAVAAIGCANLPAMAYLCVQGVGEALESMNTAKNAGAMTDPSGNPLSDSPDFCSSNPGLCNQPSTLSPDLQQAIADLAPLAKTQGVDVNDPNSVNKFLNDHANDASDSGSGGANMQLPQSVQAKIEQKQKELFSKYHISSVAVEGNGGGRGFYGGHKDSAGGRDGLDLSKLLNAANGNRLPSSTDGLQRRLASGEPVGVASDDIFKQISRRYQNKINAKMFLAPKR